MALGSLWARVTKVDCAVIALLLLGFGASLFVTFDRSVGERVIIYTGEKIAFVGPLTQDRHLEMQGPLGTTWIEIEAGKVHVSESPCRRKICIAMGAVHRSGDLLACVPNKVVVRIEGKETRDYDALSR